MTNQYYKITKGSGEVFFAEVPAGKKLISTSSIDRQLKIWYENIVGGKYRGQDMEATKVKEVPKGAMWLSFHPSCLGNALAPKKKKLQVNEHA